MNHTPPPDACCLDPNVLLDAVAGDSAAFRQLMSTFLRVAPPMLERLARAVASGDAALSAREGHALRGSAALVGAQQLLALVERLEGQARLGSAGALAPCMPAIDAELQRVLASVRRYADGSLTPAGA